MPNPDRAAVVRDRLYPGLSGQMTRRFGTLWKAEGYRADLVIHNGGLLLAISQGGERYQHGLLSAKDIAEDNYRDKFSDRMTWLIEDAHSKFTHKPAG